MSPTRRQSGIASHTLIAALALGLGAGAMWMFGSRAPAPASTPLDAITTHGEWIRIPNGADTIRAYVAFPERPDAAPAVITIHEVFGMTDWEPTVADRFAGRGYVAIVPDLLSSRWGMSPPTADSGRKLIAQLTPEGITRDLEAVYSWLEAQPSVRGEAIGVIGFCWGGGQSFRYATNNPKLKATIVCYGPAPDSSGIARIASPVMGVYGENDARINSALPTVVRQMNALGKSFAPDSYPGTGHGFLKPGRRGHDTDQVEKAWNDIFAFVGRTLGQ